MKGRWVLYQGMRYDYNFHLDYFDRLRKALPLPIFRNFCSKESETDGQKNQRCRENWKTAARRTASRNFFVFFSRCLWPLAPPPLPPLGHSTAKRAPATPDSLAGIRKPSSSGLFRLSAGLKLLLPAVSPHRLESARKVLSRR